MRWLKRLLVGLYGLQSASCSSDTLLMLHIDINEKKLLLFAHLYFSTNAGFRISLTGTALEQRATPQVVKKLKLVGTPTKIYKNSAFISGTCCFSTI